MHYLHFLGRRFAYSLLVLIGLSIIIFFISRILPGDPARMALGPFATEEQIQALTEDMGLDKPLIYQYGTYFSNLLRGDFGRSLVSERNVRIDLINYLPATLELILATIFWVLLLGVPLGVFSAVYQKESVEAFINGFTFAAVVTPDFIIGLAFQLIFGYLLNVLPITGRLNADLSAPLRVTGLLTLDSFLARDWTVFGDALRHLLLPSLALSFAGIGQVARITRASMLETEKMDYVSVMRSYGVPDNIIHFKFMLKPSFIPTLNVAGMTFASLLGNAFLIEMVFSWPGIAKYGINSLVKKDINALVGVVLVIGVAFLLINLIVDILMGYFDPRIRLQGEQ